MTSDAATSDHFCSWQSQAVSLSKIIAAQGVALQAAEAKLAELHEEVEAYKQRLFGKKSEKMRPPGDELRRRGDILPIDPAELRKKRADGQKWKEELPTDEVVHLVPEVLEPCEHCGEVPARPMPDEVSYTIDLVPARVVRHRHLQQKVRCGCGSCIVTAPPPARVGDKVQYGPRLASSLIVAKCLDAEAVERYAKGLQRIGVPISANTLFDLFHRSAQLITRLYELLVAAVRTHAIILADGFQVARRTAAGRLSPVGSDAWKPYSDSGQGQDPAGVDLGIHRWRCGRVHVQPDSQWRDTPESAGYQ